MIDDNGSKHNGLPVGAAASTGGMNSITYNISCCGGLPRTPIKPIQIEAFYKACAEKIKELGLTVNDFYTHAEIGDMCLSGEITKLLPMNSYLKQNIDKVDLTTIPSCKGSATKTGNFIRNKIKWYSSKL